MDIEEFLCDHGIRVIFDILQVRMVKIYNYILKPVQRSIKYSKKYLSIAFSFVFIITEKCDMRKRQVLSITNIY